MPEPTTEQTRSVEPLAWSIPEAAEALAVGESHLRRLIRTGDFPHVRLGGRIVVPVDAARAWLAEQVA